MFSLNSSNKIAALLFVITVFSNFLSFSLMPIILPDSESYLNFSSNRTSIYPVFLDFIIMFTSSFYIVILVQITIYLTTYFFLVKIIHEKFESLPLTLLFGLSIGSNLYLQSFNSSIVSESLVFSIINLIIICLIKIINSTRDNVLIITMWLGLLTGMLFGLKPSMITLIPTLFIVMVLFSIIKSFPVFRLAIVFLAPLIISIAAEGILHKSYHEKRTSFLGKLMFGKATLIMTNSKAELPQYLDEKDINRLMKVKELVEPVKNFREETTDDLKVKALKPRIEVFGQYRVSPILENYFGLDKENSAQMMRIGTAVVWSNLLLYTKNSLYYFLSFWYINEVTSPYIFKDTEQNLFTSDFLNEIVPKEKSAFINFLSSIGFFIFFTIGFISLFFSILSWILTLLVFVKGTKKTSNFQIVFIGSLFFLVQVNVLFVSFINVPMARYLMPLFPIYILAILLLFKYFIEMLKSSKGKMSAT